MPSRRILFFLSVLSIFAALHAFGCSGFVKSRAKAKEAAAPGRAHGRSMEYSPDLRNVVTDSSAPFSAGMAADL